MHFAASTVRRVGTADDGLLHASLGCRGRPRPQVGLRRVHHRSLLPDRLVRVPRRGRSRRRRRGGCGLGRVRRGRPQRVERQPEVAGDERPARLAWGGRRRSHGRRDARGRRRPERGPGHRLQPVRERRLDPQPLRRRRGAHAGGGGPRDGRGPRDRRGAGERRFDAAAQRLRAQRVGPPGLARAARRGGGLRLGDVQRERRRGRHERGRLQGGLRPHRHPLHHGPRPRREPARGERGLWRGEGLEPGGRPRGPRGGPPRLRRLRRRAPPELRRQRPDRGGRERGWRARDDRGRQRLQLRDRPLHEPVPDALHPEARPHALERERLRLDRDPGTGGRAAGRARGLRRHRDRGAEPGRRPTSTGTDGSEILFPSYDGKRPRLLAGQDRARELAVHRPLDGDRRRHLPLRRASRWWPTSTATGRPR